MGMIDLDAIVFVYKHKETGNIEAEFLKEALVFEDNADYEHVATINPRLWIKAHYENIEFLSNAAGAKK
jgi:hypothetical protein